MEVPDQKAAGEISPPATLNTAYFSGLGEAHDNVRNNVAEMLQSPLQKKNSRVSILLKKFEDTAAAARAERENQKSPKPHVDLNASGYHESIPSEANPMNNSSGYFESTAAANDSDAEDSEEEFDPLSHVKGYAASDFDDLLGADVPNTKKFEDSSPLISPRKEDTVKVTKLVEEFKNRDWSAEYHSLLAQIGYEHAQPEENFDKICQLVMTLNDLAEDFLTAAEVINSNKRISGQFLTWANNRLMLAWSFQNRVPTKKTKIVSRS